MNSLPERFTGHGLLDLQMNGYAEVDFNGDPARWTSDEFHRIREMLNRRGVLAALPTLVTDDAEAMLARADRYGELVSKDRSLSECFVRLHVEGPFISPEDGPRGAHPLEHCLTPGQAPELIERLREASGDRIAIVTLAPELPGAIELISRLCAAGICPAVGHTQCSKEILDEAIRAGAKLATHLGNATHLVLPRLDNYVQTQLADDRLPASFIPDGHHMPFSTLKNFIRAKSPQRSVLISDAISAAEMPPGNYRLGGQEVVVRTNGACTVPHAEHLAGSTLTLDRAVINTCRYCDVSFERAWAMGSTQPAEIIGLPPLEEITVTVGEAGFVRV